jgi:hypothetical protein
VFFGICWLVVFLNDCNVCAAENLAAPFLLQVRVEYGSIHREAERRENDTGAAGSVEDFAATWRICFAATGVLDVYYISNPRIMTKVEV